MLTLATGAKLRFDPWDGDTFSVGLVPEGRFEAMAANLGPGPIGLAQFLVDAQGQRDSFRLTMQQDGQTVEFDRVQP